MTQTLCATLNSLQTVYRQVESTSLVTFFIAATARFPYD